MPNKIVVSITWDVDDAGEKSKKVIKTTFKDDDYDDIAASAKKWIDDTIKEEEEEE
jgi:hypothetical protein